MDGLREAGLRLHDLTKARNADERTSIVLQRAQLGLPVKVPGQNPSYRPTWPDEVTTMIQKATLYELMSGLPGPRCSHDGVLQDVNGIWSVHKQVEAPVPLVDRLPATVGIGRLRLYQRGDSDAWSRSARNGSPSRPSRRIGFGRSATHQPA